MSTYCRVHGLTVDRFRRQRGEITEREARKSAAASRRKRRWTPVPKAKRRPEAQAFWALRVEAWIWGCLNLHD
jgi:hypothetical protein